MKSRALGVKVRAAAVWLALLVAIACGGEETRTYSVRGQVARVADGGRTLAIDHETIPGYMTAMQMTLPVRDAASSEALRPGDKIRFELFVSGGSAVIGSIEKLPGATALDLAGGS